MMDWTDVEMELCATGQEQLALWASNEVLQMHGLLLWALQHHQGNNSPVGQPIRKALGIGVNARLTAVQLTHAKQTADSLPFNVAIERQSERAKPPCAGPSRMACWPHSGEGRLSRASLVRCFTLLP